MKVMITEAMGVRVCNVLFVCLCLPYRCSYYAYVLDDIDRMSHRR